MFMCWLLPTFVGIFKHRRSLWLLFTVQLRFKTVRVVLESSVTVDEGDKMVCVVCISN